MLHNKTCGINFLKFKYYRSIIFTQQNKAHWSSGQDVALSRRKQGFESPTGHQNKKDIFGCPFLFCIKSEGLEL